MPIHRYYTDYWGLGMPIEYAIVTWVLALAPGVINSIFNFCFLCQINPGVDMPKWTYSLGESRKSSSFFFVVQKTDRIEVDTHFFL